MTYTWNFDDNTMPTTFFNVLGDWSVSGGELAQTGSFADPDFPRILNENLAVEDFHLSVRCKLISGSTDRACCCFARSTATPT